MIDYNLTVKVLNRKLKLLQGFFLVQNMVWGVVKLHVLLRNKKIEEDIHTYAFYVF